MILDFAIFKLNPHIAYIRDGVAFDAEHNEVTFDLAAAQALVQSSAYVEKRAAAYPSIADQLDLLYHGGMDAWKTAITAVKEEFPK